MKKAKFLVSHFEAGALKYKAGEAHDLTDDTRLCIARGAAVEVDVPDEPAASDGDAAGGDAAATAAGDAQAAQGGTPAADAPAGDAKTAKAKK